MSKYKIYKYVLILGLICITIYLITDYIGPKEIKLKSGNAFGYNSLQAPDLLIQEIDQSGNVWASRGMIIYKKKENESVFKQVGHVPTGLSIFWLRNFSFVRWVTQRNECVEITITEKNTIIAMSAGRIWRKSNEDIAFKPVYQLRHYGLGDQGIFNNGLLSTNDGKIYYGEYFRNEIKKDVHLYVSEDDGKSWEVRIRFPENKIRHIHSVQQDPFTNDLWMTTGDELGNYIYRSKDGFNSLQLIGFGETFFTTHLVFTPTSVFWGGDSENPKFNGLYVWDKAQQTTKSLGKMPHIFWYGTRLENGKIIFTSEREGFNFEKDLQTRIAIGDENNNWKLLKAGTWTKLKSPLFQRAKLRMPRNAGTVKTVWMTILKQKEIPDATLIGIDASLF